MLELTGSPHIPLEGKIRNLSGTFTNSQNLNLSWELEQVVDNTNFQTAIVFDGTITDRNENEDTASEVFITSDGAHSLEAVRLAKNVNPYNYRNFASGNNIFLDWEQSTSGDLQSYIVKRNGSTIETISNTVVDTKEYIRLDSGGRYTVWGAYASRYNGSLSVTFGTNEFTFDGQTIEFLTAGSTFQLSRGIKLTLHDEPSLYSGSFDIFLGIRNYTILKNQPSGDNVYEIIPVDLAGNVGTAVTKTINVLEMPDTAFAFDLDSLTVTNFGTNIDVVRVYSDYMPANSTTLPYVYEECHVQELNLLNPSVSLPIGAKFFLKPVVNGIEFNSVSLYTVPNPAVQDGSIGEIADMLLTPTQNGNMTLSFIYELQEDDKMAVFNIYGSDDGEIFVNIGSVLKSQTTRNYGFLLEYEVDLGLALADGVEYFVYVKAADSDSLESDASETVSAIADAVAPSVPGALHGLQL